MRVGLIFLVEWMSAHFFCSFLILYSFFLCLC